MEEAPPFGANPIDYTVNLGNLGAVAEPKEAQYDPYANATAYPDYEFDPSTVDQAYPEILQSAAIPAATGAALGAGAAHLFPGLSAKHLRTLSDLAPITDELRKKYRAQALGANWKRLALGTGLGALGGYGAHALLGDS